MAKGKSFNTVFISSWKYAGTCANPKETFRYPNFPKGDVKTVFGKSLHQGVCDGTQYGD